MFAIESFESDFQESFFIKLCVPVFFQLVHWALSTLYAPIILIILVIILLF